jgi:hypothetical protein
MTHARPASPADQEAQEKARRLQQQAAEIRAAFRSTFTSDPGRRVLAILSSSASEDQPVFRPTGPGGSYDPLAAAFRDGRRSILLEIRDLLAHPEDQLDQIPGAIR